MLPQIFIRQVRRSDGQIVPERLQRRSGVIGIAGNDGAVESADGNPGHHIGTNTGFFQRLDRAAFKTAISATALQDENGLVRDVAKREFRIGQLCLAGLQIDPMLDHDFRHLGLF